MSDFAASLPEPVSPTTIPRSRLFAMFGIAVVLSVGLGMVSWGGQVIYPFRLFATWAHEMGHGIGGILTGNTFVDLELYQNLGGQARIAGASGISQVIVSSLGLIGPAILGAIVMVLGSRAKTAPYVLGALAVFAVVSAFLWIRNTFGFVSILIIGVALALFAKFAPTTARVVICLLYTSPSPRDATLSRMPSSA